MPRKSKKSEKVQTKLEKLTQTTGQTAPINKPIPRSLDELFGDTGVSKYKTLDLDKYEASLKEMTKSDLQDHAIKVGLVPVDDYARLKANLVRQFVAHCNNYKQIPPPTNNCKKITPEVKRIMSEGR